MIIKRLYIESFGGVKDRLYEWNDGLNIIYAPNESGKSTTAEFIRAMLYGHSGRGQDVRNNSRRHYLPLDGSPAKGEMTVEYNGNTVCIQRTFGKTKAGDKITVTDAVTGKEVPELMCDAPGNIICSIGEKGFENSLYIRQLQSKINGSDSDEILKKLMNLAQSGDEDVSYSNAIKLLDAQIKEISYSRPKGKIQIAEEKIAQLYTEKSASRRNEESIKSYERQIVVLNEESERLKNQKNDNSYINMLREALSKAKAEKEDRQKAEKKTKRLSLFALLTLILSVVLSFVYLPLAIISLVAFAMLLCLFVKNKKNIAESETEKFILKELDIEHINDAENAIAELESSDDKEEERKLKRLMEISQQIGGINSRIKAVEIVPDFVFQKEIEKLEKEIEESKRLMADIIFARDSLEAAFDSLQQGFGVKLNEVTSEIMNKISEGKYTEVLTDESFNITLREGENGNLIDGAYLSTGAYDTVYLALRLAVAKLVFPHTPIILDDALTCYDDSRHRAAMEYIKTLNRQVILFTCHKRETKYA